MSLCKFIKMKEEKRKISMVTSYDYWSAKLLNESPVDCLLVGDSLAMVMHGHNTTLPATVDVMALHTRAVATGAPDKFIVGDLPFLSFRKDLTQNMEAVEKIMHAGAHSVKLEGAAGNLDLVQHIVESGVPVMGHLGLTPQSIHQLGGFKVQGRGQDAAHILLEQAHALEERGCFALVLECVPAPLAREISQSLTIPTIGIGAGPDTDGQVLVLQDLLGFNKGFKPKFLRHFMNGAEQFSQAIQNFDQAVKGGSFPNLEESYE
jgi:3-methyl-2-oxobutanoate hydroxymethyltransferase